MSPARGAIKVTYKTPSNCEESDSDADVVVEEEKEYDVAGGSVNVGMVHGSFPRLGAPSSLLPQSMTHLSDGHRQGKSPPKSKKTAQMPPVPPAVIRPPNVKTSVDVPSKKLSSAHLAQQKQIKPPTVQERVQQLIQGGTRVMVLMRGAPGSGKTHLATQIVKLTMGNSGSPSSFVFSTDDFFVRTKRFIPALLPDAHAWNQERVRAAAERKWSPIFVDNTNTEVSIMFYIFIIYVLKSVTFGDSEFAFCSCNSAFSASRVRRASTWTFCHINLECDCMLKAPHKVLILVTLLGLRMLEGCRVGCRDSRSAYQSLVT